MTGRCKRCKKRRKKVSKAGLTPGFCKSCITLTSYYRRKKIVAEIAYCQKCGKKIKTWNIVETLMTGKLKICDNCYET